MILNTEEAEERLNSSDNLINRLRLETGASRRKLDAMQTFGIIDRPADPINVPMLPPPIDSLIDDVENKLALSSAYSSSVQVMQTAVEMLGRNLINIDPTKPEKLSRIASDMSRIVSSINESRNGKRSGDGSVVIVYKPVMMAENHYDVIQVNE